MPTWVFVGGYPSRHLLSWGRENRAWYLLWDTQLGVCDAFGRKTRKYRLRLGSCALAPVMLVDGTYHNKLKLEDVPGIVERYRLADAGEGEAGND